MPRQEKFSSPGSGREKINFENSERPHYRYYYHGTVMINFEKMKSSGHFNFKEYYPNFTLSPLYGFEFLVRTAENAEDQARKRGKYYGRGVADQLKPEDLAIENHLVLIVEPTSEYDVHSTNEGMPNVFSTPDQIPDDIDETVRTRIWNSYQYAAAREPIGDKTTEEHRYPSMFLNKIRLPNGQWVSLEREKRISTLGEFPASAVKMAISRDQKFLDIFKKMREELDRGGKVDLVRYKKQLIDYFENGRGIIKNEVEDEAELAENMAVGEFEYYIVAAMRNLYLDIQAYKGKKVVHPTKEEKVRSPKSREQIMERIATIRSLEPDNEVFKRYIEVFTDKLEKELSS